jgi:hypothetical protein
MGKTPNNTGPGAFQRSGGGQRPAVTARIGGWRRYLGWTEVTIVWQTAPVGTAWHNPTSRDPPGYALDVVFFGDSRGSPGVEGQALGLVHWGGSVSC